MQRRGGNPERIGLRIRSDRDIGAAVERCRCRRGGIAGNQQRRRTGQHCHVFGEALGQHGLRRRQRSRSAGGKQLHVDIRPPAIERDEQHLPLAERTLRQAGENRLKAADADEPRPEREGDPVCRGEAHADPGEASRPRRDSDGPELRRRHARFGHHPINHREQHFGMTVTQLSPRRRHDRAVAENRCRAAGSGGVDR